jgi:hypothetical protein
MSKPQPELFKVLASKPDVRPKRTISLAEKIVLEYKDKYATQDYVALPFANIPKGEYKNISALARMLGKFVKKMNLKNVKVVKDEQNVYFLKEK